MTAQWPTSDGQEASHTAAQEALAATERSPERFELTHLLEPAPGGAGTELDDALAISFLAARWPGPFARLDPGLYGFYAAEGEREALEALGASMASLLCGDPTALRVRALARAAAADPARAAADDAISDGADQDAADQDGADQDGADKDGADKDGADKDGGADQSGAAEAALAALDRAMTTLLDGIDRLATAPAPAQDAAMDASLDAATDANLDANLDASLDASSDASLASTPEQSEAASAQIVDPPLQILQPISAAPEAPFDPGRSAAARLSAAVGVILRRADAAAMRIEASAEQAGAAAARAAEMLDGVELAAASLRGRAEVLEAAEASVVADGAAQADDVTHADGLAHADDAAPADEATDGVADLADASPPAEAGDIETAENEIGQGENEQGGPDAVGTSGEPPAEAPAALAEATEDTRAEPVPETFGEPMTERLAETLADMLTETAPAPAAETLEAPQEPEMFAGAPNWRVDLSQSARFSAAMTAMLRQASAAVSRFDDASLAMMDRVAAQPEAAAVAPEAPSAPARRDVEDAVEIDAAPLARFELERSQAARFSAAISAMLRQASAAVDRLDAATAQIAERAGEAEAAAPAGGVDAWSAVAEALADLGREQRALGDDLRTRLDRLERERGQDAAARLASLQPEIARLVEEVAAQTRGLDQLVRDDLSPAAAAERMNRLERVAETTRETGDALRDALTGLGAGGADREEALDDEMRSAEQAEQAAAEDEAIAEDDAPVAAALGRA